MTKTPPSRRGITFKVGEQLEARDSLKNWYAASIERIDYEEERVLIHYRQWSHRYDEWFDWASPYLRPMERIQLRREGLQEDGPIPGFQVNEKVLASWSDCRFYPAKVLAVNKDASYTVKFFDGVVQRVKGIHVKPFAKEGRRGKARSPANPKDKQQDGKTGKPLENGRGLREKGNVKNKGGRCSNSNQDVEGDTEEEEEEEEEKDEGKRDEQKKTRRGKVGKTPKDSKKKMTEQQEDEEEEEEVEMEVKKTTVGRTKKPAAETEITRQMKNGVGESDVGVVRGRELGRRRVRASPGRPGAVDGQVSRTEGREVNGSEERMEDGEDGASGEEKLHVTEMTKEEEKEKEKDKGSSQPADDHVAGEEKVTGETSSVCRKRKAPLAEGCVENQPEVLKLRRRSICLGQTAPSKRSKSDSGTDKVSPAESVPGATPSHHRRGGVSPDGARPAAAVSKKEAEHVQPAGEEGPARPNQGLIASHQIFLPSSHKYSREPLYRVIKNQPPPVLSINLDHNPFKCTAPGCSKSFRKAKLLHYHVKYYHGGDKASDGELSPGRGVQTRASERQAAALERASPRRKRTVSAPLNSSLHSPRGHGRAGRLTERKRASGPPALNGVTHQRALLRETCKNQLEKTGRGPQGEEREQSAVDPEAKGKERLKEKKYRDFLRIKLKRRRRKKKKKPVSEYTGSEENIDISMFDVQSKLNLPHKFPFAHKHKLLYNASLGHYSTEQTQGDDEDSESDWSTDSPAWSEEELGEELDVTTPPQIQGMALTTAGSEIVRCICEVEEDDDFMIQCEECLSWQHGTCMGLLQSNVPEKYTCHICRDPPGQRECRRYWYDRDWLSRGLMYGLPFVEDNYSHQNGKKISATHQLLGDVHHVMEVLHGLQLKISILQSQAHPDLKLWCQPWKQAEKPRRKAETGAAALAADDGPGRERGGACRATDAAAEEPCRAFSFQDSYISSEHCYQKPRTYYPAVEQRLVVETRGSELEDSLRSTEDLLTLEHRYGGPLDPDRGKIHPSLQLDENLRTKKPDCVRKPSGEVENEDVELGAVDVSLQQQWQLHLLDHIEAVQEEVTHRMDFIERELDVLESWLDYTGELEPPEPLARLPQLKHRIKHLLTELGKVQQIALCCST